MAKGPKVRCLAPFELYQKPTNGAGKEESLLNSEKEKLIYDWSGDFVLFREMDSGGFVNLWVLRTSGERKAVPFSPVPYRQAVGRLSPDGHWVAYASGETGVYQVVLQSFPSAGFPVPVTADGGNYPRWGHNGKELYYLAPGGGLMAVPIRVTGTGASAAPVPGQATRLFTPPIVGGFSTALAFRAQDHVSADGQKFLVNLETDDADAVITTIINWPALLKK